MLIGLTGGIGSGKSTIAKELKARGYQVYDTDTEAKRLILQQSDIRRAMIDLLGDDIFDGDTYRTDIVTKRIFADKSLLHKLNAIVHPAVKSDVQNWAKDKKLCFVESAILYESGLDSICDNVVAIIADDDIRIKRTMARDNVSADKVKARMKMQMSNYSLIHKADYVIETNGDTSIAKLVDFLMCKIQQH